VPLSVFSLSLCLPSSCVLILYPPCLPGSFFCILYLTMSARYHSLYSLSLPRLPCVPVCILCFPPSLPGALGVYSLSPLSLSGVPVCILCFPLSLPGPLGVHSLSPLSLSGVSVCILCFPLSLPGPLGVHSLSPLSLSGVPVCILYFPLSLPGAPGCIFSISPTISGSNSFRVTEMSPDGLELISILYLSPPLPTYIDFCNFPVGLAYTLLSFIYSRRGKYWPVVKSELPPPCVSHSPAVFFPGKLCMYPTPLRKYTILDRKCVSQLPI
jgi:hypothetical protein